MKRPDKLPIAAFVLIILLTLLVYHGVIFRPGMVYGKDTVVQGYPINWYQEMHKSNDIAPSWFPYMMSGFPTTPAVYPTDALMFILPVTRFITWRFILHTMAAAALMFLMMRRFGCRNSAAMIGAIAFGFSAFFISKIYAGHGYAIWTGTWIPLSILLLDQTIETKRAKYAILTGGCVGLQILGQHPQYVFYTLIAMALYTIWKVIPQVVADRKLRRISTLAGLAVLTALFAFFVSAHHLLPFLEFTRLSNRGGGTGYEYASSLSMHPAQIITAVFPSFMGSPKQQNSVFGALYWDSAMYIGLIPFVLAIIAFFWVKGPRASYFKVLAVLSLLLALGDHTPFYKFIYHIPGFSMVRAPAKVLFLYSFAAAALAAYGAELLFSVAPRLHPRRANVSIDMIEPESTPMARKIGKLFTYSFGALFVGLLIWLMMRGTMVSVGQQVIKSTRSDAAEAAAKLPGLVSLQTHSIMWAVVFVGLGALTVAGLLKRRISSGFAATAIVAIAFVDLCMYANPLLYTVDARKEFNKGDHQAISLIQADHSRFRVLPLDTNTFQYAAGVFYGIESVNGYYPVSLARYASYVGAIEHKPRYVDVSADITNPNSQLVDLLNVKYVLSSKPIKSVKLVPVHLGRTYVYRNTEAFSRAFIIHNATTVPNADAALKAVSSPGFDPKSAVILENNRTLPSYNETRRRDFATVRTITPREIQLTADLSAPGYLVFSEIYYPGWRATVDNKPADVLPADYLFRAVQLPAGRHEVRMRFVSAPYNIGMTLTVLSVLFIAGMLIIDYRKTKSGIQPSR